jgi:hypothetical protein
LLSNGDLLINGMFFTFEDRIGERLLFIITELFSIKTLDDRSLLDLKNNKAGVVVFFLEEKMPQSDGWFEFCMD